MTMETAKFKAKPKSRNRLTWIVLIKILIDILIPTCLGYPQIYNSFQGFL